MSHIQSNNLVQDRHTHKDEILFARIVPRRRLRLRPLGAHLPQVRIQFLIQFHAENLTILNYWPFRHRVVRAQATEAKKEEPKAAAPAKETGDKGAGEQEVEEAEGAEGVEEAEGGEGGEGEGAERRKRADYYPK